MYRSVVGFVCATVMVTGAAVAAEPGLESGGATYSIDIVGHVPVICRASLDATVVAATPGESELGSLNEFCNSPSGYEVFVENSPELAGSVLYVDGQAVTLTAAPTRISSSDQPAITSRNIRLANAGGSGGSLSFRIAAR